MEKINVCIANGSYLPGQALKSLVQSLNGYDLVSFCNNEHELLKMAKACNIDLLFIDFSSEGFSLNAINWFKRNLPDVAILAILPYPEKTIIKAAFDAGIGSIILNECSRSEIVEAMTKTYRGHQFICGKILEAVDQVNHMPKSEASCDGVSLTTRELDIIKMIAHGNSNKEIADILCLSNHTINTHRKNIMSKLRVNNTAGLVMYAVKENLLDPNKFLFS